MEMFEKLVAFEGVQSISSQICHFGILVVLNQRCLRKYSRYNQDALTFPESQRYNSDVQGSLLYWEE